MLSVHTLSAYSACCTTKLLRPPQRALQLIEKHVEKINRKFIFCILPTKGIVASTTSSKQHRVCHCIATHLPSQTRQHFYTSFALTKMSGIYLTDRPVRRSQVTGNPLYRKIQRACRMSLPEPDLSLNLDVADYINEKQGGAAFDAVNAIVKLINAREPHTAVFALALLDVLVKNCGYPLHLQISRKEFLNQLVRRFPEHPPMRYSKVHKLILTAIEEWYQTICKHSSYKDDMTYIRDMRRLLKYKGYIFPKIKADDLAVMKPTDVLKSASEIQKEQEIAQAAKLEELIRSGKPEDLREANKLMKVMAGFKEDNIIQAKQMINNDLNKLRRKADLLNEMLSSTNEIDLKNNETIEELYAALKGAQPKFQKIIEEEHDDDNLVQDLLKFNDIVNQLLEKYSLLKSGNKTAASAIQPTIPTSSNQTTNNNNNGGALANEINLLDFDDDMGATGSPSPATIGNSTSTNDPIIDLLGGLNDLSVSNNSSQQQNNNNGNVGGIILDSHTNDLLSQVNSNSQHSAQPQSNDLDLFGDFNQPATTNNSLQQPQSKRISVNSSNNLKFDFLINKLNDSSIHIKVFFSNLSFEPLTQFTFALAVPKNMQLNLQPQSNTILNSLVNDGIIQELDINSATNIFNKPLRVKWKINYLLSGSMVEETNVFTLPNL